MLKHLLLSEICASEMYEKFVYKHSETIEYVNSLLFFASIDKILNLRARLSTRL